MADEEVDWGVEDVLSLGGEDSSMAPTEAASSGKEAGVNGHKAPPTGPRSSTSTAEQASPLFPHPIFLPLHRSFAWSVLLKSTSSTSTSKPSNSGASSKESGPDSGEEQPLPPGWEKLTSRTHGKVFYYKRETNQTSWTFPDSPPQAEAVTNNKIEAAKAQTSNPTPAKESVKENTVVQTPAPAPAPAATPNATAASTAGVSTSPNTGRAVPSGPASWRNTQPQDSGRERELKRSPPASGDNKRSDRPDQPSVSDNDRETKRTRMASPPTGPAGPAPGNRYGPRSDNVPRRPLSPPRPPSGPSRSNSNYNYRNGPPPRGPASSSVPIRQPAGPGLATNGFDQSRRDVPPPRPRSPARRPENQVPAPAPFVARGPNQAPLANNRWGTASGSATPSSRPADSTPTPSYRNDQPRSSANPPVSSAAEDERAKLLAKKRKAQEELEAIQKEEERLEKLEIEKKKRDEEKVKRDTEDRRREDERRSRDVGIRAPPPPLDDRRRGFDDRRRDDRALGGERDNPRSYRPGPGARSPPPRRALSPPPRRALSPPPRRPLSPPPLSSRLDSYSRRSPPPMYRRSRSPPPPIAGRMRSPPPAIIRGGGDSYRPDRDGPIAVSRDLAARMGPRRDERDVRDPRDPRDVRHPRDVRDIREPRGSGYAEPMAGYPSRGPEPRGRPLVERMAPDDRDRSYRPSDDRDRRW